MMRITEEQMDRLESRLDELIDQQKEINRIKQRLMGNTETDAAIITGKHNEELDDERQDFVAQFERKLEMIYQTQEHMQQDLNDINKVV